MKALTVRDPYAMLIADGVKDVENRVGGTSYRGPLAIHVSQTFDDGALTLERVRQGLGANRGSSRDRQEAIGHARDHATAMAGHVIAVVELVDVHLATGYCCPSWGDRRAPNGRTMRHLVLAHARRLATPIRTGGSLGLWLVDDDLIEQAGWAA